MIIFKAKKDLDKDGKRFEKMLADRLLNPNQAQIYVSPFCLFLKSFYTDWKESIKGIFVGEINIGLFNLSLTSKAFSTQTRLPLTIKCKRIKILCNTACFEGAYF